MAHSKSAEKRIRQNAKRRLRNRSARSALRTAVKKFKVTLESGDGKAVQDALRTVQKTVDKTAGKGIVAKRTAARMKSRLSARANAAGSTESA